MPWSAAKKRKIADILRENLRKKMRDYTPEPAKMPFHTRLLGKDRMALFSFIHSLNTNFGTHIFDPVAKALAEDTFREVACQQIVGKQIASEAQVTIQSIMNDLSTGTRSPNKKKEIADIRRVCRKGERNNIKLTRADIKLVGHDGTIYWIDIKTAKPNFGGAKGMKQTLLEWTAATLLEDPRAKVQPLICIPYNPYAPKPYQRWTFRAACDLQADLKVAEEFWDFLAGEGSYETLLTIFEKVGIELRPEIDAYFKRYL